VVARQHVLPACPSSLKSARSQGLHIDSFLQSIVWNSYISYSRLGSRSLLQVFPSRPWASSGGLYPRIVWGGVKVAWFDFGPFLHLTTTPRASLIMAVNTPLSPGGKNELRLPMPPPLLHTRSGNELYERTQTPINNGFTTPVQTPQGSPSKNRMPPGANELPNVFENAMKLIPSSPTKPGRQQQMPLSPTKNGMFANEDTIMGGEESMLRKDLATVPGSPTRKSGKENTPPGGRFAKDMTHTPNQAAVSRQEQYTQREQKTIAPLRGLTSEELEKLQLPKVKRLANVTQLCKLLHTASPQRSTNLSQISSITTSTSLAMFITGRTVKLNSRRRSHPHRSHQLRSMNQP
jgi:hypothetical protein